MQTGGPTEPSWHTLPHHLDVRSCINTPSPGHSDVSLQSLESSERISGSPIAEPHSPRIPDRGPSEGSTTVGYPNLPQVPVFEPVNWDADGPTDNTEAPGSSNGVSIAETNLGEDLPDADDVAICFDSESVVFWTGRAVIPYTRTCGRLYPDGPIFFRPTSGIACDSLKTSLPNEWIDASLSGPYFALAKSGPSSLQVKVLDLKNRRNVQPSTQWPSFQGLRSLCISSQGWLALFYDKVVRFQCIEEATHLRKSSWLTSSENINSACFSQDGTRFFGVSWTHLWIGRLQNEQWMLSASGDHHLSARPWMTFHPYLVPFNTREALFAHNPAEDNLRYLEANSSTKVDLGAGVIRIAISKNEDMIIYVRKLRRAGRSTFLSRSFYGLAWRPIGRSQAKTVYPGAESDTTDLNIAVEKNKKFSLTSSFDQGMHFAWVATSKGEIRKCPLM